MPTTKYLGGVLADISIERERQSEIFPKQEPEAQPCNRYQMLPVIVEELGEVAKGINEKDPRQIREELVHTAATCAKLVETMDAGNEPMGIQLEHVGTGFDLVDVPTDQELGAGITYPGDDDGRRSHWAR